MAGKILIVDDSAVARKELKQQFGKNGFDVLEAADAAEGLEMLKSEAVVLVLCDVVMPGMDGKKMVSALRKIDGLATLPVVMLTADLGNNVDEMSHSAVETVWITKPINHSILLEVATRALNAAN